MNETSQPMSAPMRSIVYVSSATHELTTQELEDLLVEARELNRVNGITGVLLHSDGNFMQYFEGTRDAVDETYLRIIASSKHKDLIELMNGPIAERRFGAWKMGLAQPTRSELSALSTAQWRQRCAGASSGGVQSVGFELLQKFWQRAQGCAPILS
jgi:hypothetical protein